MAGRTSIGVGVGVTKGMADGGFGMSFLSATVSPLWLSSRDLRGVGVGVGLFPRFEMERPTLLKNSPTGFAATLGSPDAKTIKEKKRANLRRTRTMALSCTQSTRGFKQKRRVELL